MILINFLVRIIKLVIVILNIAYFLGFFWFIITDLFNVLNSAHVEPKGDSVQCPEGKENFLCYFGIFDDHYDFGNSNSHIGISMMYFAFTSLSTVGFGDFHPRSNQERLVTAMILLFGVATFSYCMGIFIGILGTYETLNAELDDGDNLSRFFGMLKHFNGDQPINTNLQKSIEEFFDYKWNKDRNQAMDDDQEQALLEQLPIEVQNNIFCKFLYFDFISIFRETFKIMKIEGG